MTPALAAVQRCRLCACRLTAGSKDDFDLLVCAECRTRPEARRLGPPQAELVNRRSLARSFTPAEKSLIRKVHGFMSAQQLLDVLNERVGADLGPEAVLYTMEQLHAELRETPAAAAADWGGLRKLLSQARKAGLLDLITLQTIEDFAVVFSLTPAQAMRLKDVIQGASGDRT